MKMSMMQHQFPPSSSSTLHVREVILHAVLASFLELKQSSPSSSSSSSKTTPTTVISSPEPLLIQVSKSHPTLASRLKESSIPILQQTMMSIVETISKAIEDKKKTQSTTTSEQHQHEENYGIFQVMEEEEEQQQKSILDLPIEELLVKLTSTTEELRVIEQTCVALIVATVRQKQQLQQNHDYDDDETDNKKQQHHGNEHESKDMLNYQHRHGENVAAVSNNNNNDNNNVVLVSLSPPSSAGGEDDDEEMIVEEEEEEIIVEEEEEEDEEKFNHQESTPNLSAVHHQQEIDEVDNMTPERQILIQTLEKEEEERREHHNHQKQLSPFPSLLDLSNKTSNDHNNHQSTSSAHDDRHHSNTPTATSRRRQWVFSADGGSAESTSSKKLQPQITRFQDSPSKNVHDDQLSSPARQNHIMIVSGSSKKKSSKTDIDYDNYDDTPSRQNNASVATMEDMMSIIAEEVAERGRNVDKTNRSWNHEGTTTSTPRRRRSGPPPTPPAFSDEYDEEVNRNSHHQKKQQLGILRQQQNEQADQFWNEKESLKSAKLQESTFLFWWQQTALRKCAKFFVMKKNFMKWKQALEEEKSVQHFRSSTSQQALTKLAFNKWRNNFKSRFFSARRKTQIQQTIFLYWRQRTNYAPLVRAFTALRAHNIASRCFHTWRIRFDVRIETRQLEQQARETLLLRHALSRWMRKFQQSKNEKKTLWENFEKPLLKKTMDLWARAMYSKQAVRFLEQKRSLEMQKKMFNRWKKKSEEKQELVMQSIERFEFEVRNKSLLKRSLGEWKLKHQAIKLQQERNAVIARNVLMNVWKRKFLLAKDLKSREAKKLDDKTKIGFARKMLLVKYDF